MQNIIIFGIGALVCSLFLSNFIKLSSILKGEDFNFKEYISKFKLKNIDMKYAIIFLKVTSAVFGFCSEEASPN